MPNKPLSKTHYVAPLEETPLVAVDTVSVDAKPSNLYIDAWRDMRRRPLFYVAGRDRARRARHRAVPDPVHLGRPDEPAR